MPQVIATPLSQDPQLTADVARVLYNFEGDRQTDPAEFVGRIVALVNEKVREAREDRDRLRAALQEIVEDAEYASMSQADMISIAFEALNGTYTAPALP